MRCFFSLFTFRRVNTPLFPQTMHITSQAVSSIMCVLEKCISSDPQITSCENSPKTLVASLKNMDSLPEETPSTLRDKQAQESAIARVSPYFA